jgi:hypothetical protein
VNSGGAHCLGSIVAFLQLMKHRTRWIIAAVILLLLVLRLFYTHLTALSREKAWYISQLNFTFSARVDSVIRPGRALIEITGGDVDPHREWELKDDIKAHGILHLIIASGGKYDLRLPAAAMKNDSLSINSDADELSLYRNGQLIISRSLSASLRQRPF